MLELHQAVLRLAQIVSGYFGPCGDQMRKVGKMRLATLPLSAGLLGSVVCAAQGADLPTKAPPLANTVLLCERCQLFPGGP